MKTSITLYKVPNKPRCLKSILISIIVLSVFCFNVSADEKILSINEIAPGNYLHMGSHLGLGDPGHDDIANIGFIIGEKCVAVIDSGGSVDTGNALYKALRSVTDKPVCYVINTHVHFDHVLGNSVFTVEKPEFVGHVNLPDAIEANRGFFLEEFRDYLGESPTEQSIIAPDITVAENHTLDLGNRKLVLTAHEKSHTYTDLTVYDQKTKTLWAGDLVFRDRIPVIDGSLKGWIKVMQDLRKQDIALVIPGHGQPGNNWEDVLSPQEEYLSVLLNQTRDAIAQGLFMEEAIETIGREEKDKWLLFDQQHKSNVSRAFIELEWE